MYAYVNLYYSYAYGVQYAEYDAHKMLHKCIRKYGVYHDEYGTRILNAPSV
jgi:hypothetical protein